MHAVCSALGLIRNVQFLALFWNIIALRILFIRDKSEFHELLQEYGNEKVKLAKKVIQIVLKNFWR